MGSSRGAAWPLTAAAVVATAAVVAVVVIAVNLTGDGEDGSDSATDPVGQPPPPPPECPDAPEGGEGDDVDRLDPNAPDALPAGATSVRLCQGVGEPVPGAGTLLTDGVERVVRTINELEQRAEKPEMCTMDMGPGYRMVFGYRDGSTFTVSGKTYGCRELVVGSAHRIPATEPLQVFRRLAEST